MEEVPNRVIHSRYLKIIFDVIVYLNCGGGYTSVYICQDSSKCILKMGVFLYVNYILKLT